MIIYGYKSREIEKGSGQFHCPKCDAQRPYVHKLIARYFTLFFIPLFKIRTLSEYVECQVCQRAFKPIVLTDAASPAQLDALSDESQPKARDEHRSTWGSILIGAGGLTFLLGGGILLLFSMAQLFGEAGPTNNLMGFITTLVCCPLPIMLLGVTVAGAGIFVLRKDQDQDTSETIPIS
jgi:hypothetical protein